MGMIANYQQITDAELEEITSFEDVEELQENENIEICDIDKMWDALHFLLTGKSATAPIENDLISEAIVGQQVILEEEFIAGTSSARVKDIAKCLQELDFPKYLAKFDMRNFAQNQIYPSIWAYVDETEDIKKDLEAAYESLKDFYTSMAAKDYAVLVSIY